MKRSRLSPGKKSLERRSTFEQNRTALKRVTAISPASDAQRMKINGRPSLISGKVGCDAAHVYPRGLGGCDDALCVVPLTRAEHRAYDQGALDLLPYMLAHCLVPELQHALGHANGDLIGLLTMLTGTRWAPEPDERRAA